MAASSETSSAAANAVVADASGQIILVLRNLLAQRYPDLGKHLNTVARMCESVAPEVGLPEDEREALTQAAYLHDIGKLSLPESILGKAAALDEAEWRLMRRHTAIGERILVAAGLRGRVVEFVRSSHERVDGTGYPDGLAGERIPLGARIIAVCDAYQAMTSPRPYRPVPMTNEVASLELMRKSGTQFDMTVVDALCLLLRNGRPSWPSARPASSSGNQATLMSTRAPANGVPSASSSERCRAPWAATRPLAPRCHGTSGREPGQNRAGESWCARANVPVRRTKPGGTD